MPYNLSLPLDLRKAGWKVKIHDAERLEPPHVTIYQKMRKWRISLRNGSFLDKGDEWNQIEDDVRRVLERGWGALIKGWDELHPENPVKK